MPKVSVIVPVYKVENVLNYCIESILCQTFSDFELILVDDGSPDNSGKICDKYAEKDNRITVIHKENGGVSSARNAGIEHASGKYICFVDSDDFLECNYLEELINVKNKYFEYDNIWCSFQTVSNYFKDNSKQIVFNDTETLSLFNTNDIMILHEKWLDASPCNKLYNRRIIYENNIIFPLNLSLGEDLIFNLQYLDYTNGKIIVINETLYNYIRNGNDSLDNKYYPNLFEIYKRIENELLFYSKKWNLSDEQIKKVYSSSFYKYEVVLNNTFNYLNKATIFQKFKYNNNILRSKEFVNALNKMDAKIHPFYMVAYKSKNYFLVKLLDILVKQKSIIQRSKNVDTKKSA